MIRALNDTELRTDLVGAYVYATVTTDSFDETRAGLLLSELEVIESRSGRCSPASPTGCSALGVDALAAVSSEVAEHRRPAARASPRAPSTR